MTLLEAEGRRFAQELRRNRRARLLAHQTIASMDGGWWGGIIQKGIDAQPVFELDLDHPLGEPRAVSGWHPFGGVPVTFFRPVHRRIRDRQVVEVTGKRDVPSHASTR